VKANPSNAIARASTNRNPAASRIVDQFRIGTPKPQDVRGDTITDFWFVGEAAPKGDDHHQPHTGWPKKTA
jgi:hypothetical protein